jgi:hypothetical protein
VFVQSLLLWKSNQYYIFWVCLCRLRYPACNVHAQHCYLWPAQLFNVFHITSKTKQFSKKKLLNIKCLLISSQLFYCTVSHSKKNWARYDKNVYWSSRTRYSCQIIKETLIFSTYFRNCANAPKNAKFCGRHKTRWKQYMKRSWFQTVRINIQMHFVALAFCQQSDQIRKYLWSPVTNLYYMFLKTCLYHIQCPISWNSDYSIWK